MTPAERWLIAAGAGGLVLAAVLTSQPRDGSRGSGDGPEKDGLDFDVQLQLGQLQPEDHTRWHYGGGMPGEPLPSNWDRHRLGYPIRQGEGTERCAEVPLGHPAFPKRETAWFYTPPAEVNI
jgi:hypothetical protein